MVHRFFLHLRERLHPFYRRADTWTGGVLATIGSAVRHYHLANSTEAAAGLTFYAVFSLFPLLSFAVIVASLFLPQQQITGMLIDFFYPIFPVSLDLIQEAVKHFVEQRSAATVISLLGLLWASSSAFVVLTRHINRAWKDARARNYFQGRLLAIGMIVGFLLFMSLVLAASLVLALLGHLAPLLTGGPLPLFLRVAPYVLAFLLFLFLYRYIPTVPVRFSEALWGALLVSGAWGIGTGLFSLYLSTSLARFSLLYGSLATVAILMFWIYLMNIMILFGAHLTSAVARHHLMPRPPRKKSPNI